MKEIIIVGAGLAGSEAAWQAAQAGCHVTLYEMRPTKLTPAHKTGGFAELVCSNSLRGAGLENAVGVLKEEMRRLDSVIMQAADATRVPAGGALAVDRHGFSARVTELVQGHPNITVVPQEVERIPREPDAITIVASGPLTAGRLAEDIAGLIGHDSLSFYDAAAPIVSFESIDMTKAYRASRYGKGEAAYINCPMTREEYERFYTELIHAETAPLHEFDEPAGSGAGDPPAASHPSNDATGEAVVRETNSEAASDADHPADTAGSAARPAQKLKIFEGCMPIEVMAARGPRTMLFGPLKPVGLEHPETGVRPYAVVQLRQDNAEGTLYNIVGFQTHLKWGEQRRVFRLIPGLEQAEFLRYGVMHRNTFINSPAHLEPTMQLRGTPDLLFAGQMTGVEGYVESAASGLIAGRNAARLAQGLAPLVFPAETCHGALARYITTNVVPGDASAGPARHFQPMNINFGLLPLLSEKIRDKKQKKQALAARALSSLEEFRGSL